MYSYMYNVSFRIFNKGGGEPAILNTLGEAGGRRWREKLLGGFEGCFPRTF